MDYLVAIFPDRITAEEAYTALEKKNIKSTILGKGYKSADEFGLIDPKEQAKKQAKFMSYWLVPFGFFAGFGFSLVTGLDTFAWAGEIGNHVIGGLLGAGSGAMGSIFVGGGVGLFVGGGDALPYRNRLDAGKYIVVVEGEQSLKRDTTRILRQLEPENLQGYAAQ
ncbi:MAG: hypothetical protein AAFW70_07840 [Cyanobacteria bacterium J06635_10]